MKPTRLTDEDIEKYVADGYWSHETMVDRYRLYAKQRPQAIACQDSLEAYTWERLDAESDRLAANLVELGLKRDERVLVQIPSSCREFLLRVCLKKAGLIGIYVPMQWRERELGYALERLSPAAVVLPRSFKGYDGVSLVQALASKTLSVRYFIDSSDGSSDHGDSGSVKWLRFDALRDREPGSLSLKALSDRAFAFNEISLVSASSGTTGFAKLCDWPEAAQLCIGYGIAGRLQLTPDDNVGIFAPMAGAAGALLWAASGSIPCTYTFPAGYDAPSLLDSVQRARISVGTTVPVILARLLQENLESYDLSCWRALRVGTAALGRRAAIAFESRTGCRVVPAAGSMECPSFGHASVDEPSDVRLDGSVGLPLPGCQVRIVDPSGNDVRAGETGEIWVRAPFAASGYWQDPRATGSAWTAGGWYITGDLGLVGDGGRLTLVGRSKEIINRSGHKVLPLEIERVISQHPDVLECAVVGAPHADYGEVPWAFVQPRPGRRLNPGSIVELMGNQGLASYKIPSRFFQVAAFPRVNGNKVDKKRLLEMHQPAN